jgi:alcohol dehydrogenase class IV
MDLRFDHETLPQRVSFAPGEARAAVAAEVARLGATAVMVVAAPSKAAVAKEVTADLAVALLHDEVAMHVPGAVAGRARIAAARAGVDAIVTVGGGSTTGLAKAVALTTGLPIVAVPTTYAGSEATPIWGVTEEGTKTTGTDLRVVPRAVVYDSLLTRTLPVGLSVSSGLNALAHGVDSLWAPKSDPINAALAVEGIRALRAGLLQVVNDPQGLVGRHETLYGAYLSAAAFASAGSGLHHKICHVLGGAFDLPHAQTHAVMLPHVLALNEPSAPGAERRLAQALAAESGLTGLATLYERLGAPSSLRELGFKKSDIPQAAREILPVVPDNNPTPVTDETLRRLLHDAWEGRPW